MDLSRILSFFCLYFLSAQIVRLRAQSECDMIQASDIGSSTPSTDGFIALLLGGADAAARPMVSVSNVEVISLAVGTVQNMFRWASVFATYTCSGMLCPSGDYPRTEQFEVECVEPTPGNPIWTDSNLLLEDRSTPINPNLTSADLRKDCSFCLNPDDRGNLGVPAAIAIDPEFHCTACDSSCLVGNDGLGYCTSITAGACCNVYQPNGMGVNICAVSCDMGYEADSPDFICERRCPVLGDPTNGQVSHPTRTVGSVATYTCNNLFEIVGGDEMRMCQNDSTWDGTAAVCSDCPRLNNPINGMVTLSGLSVGSTASYTCDTGFFVNGAETRTCLGPGWSSSAPTCERLPERMPEPPVVDVGDDPHFSIALPSGKLLCYTMQGEHGFTFNLISNERIHMNAMFVPDSHREEVTWLGSIGIVIHSSSYMRSNGTALRFEAKDNTIHIGDKIKLKARNIEKLTFSDGKLTISEAPPVEGFKYPAVYVDLQDVGLSFTIKFMNEHLDLFWHSTGQVIGESHGIIGQFFRKGVEIDEVRKILIMPNKEPVPVMRRPVWSFMERELEVADNQLCWTAMNPGYQGEGLIDGTYFDYLVNDVLTADFKFRKQQ